MELGLAKKTAIVTGGARGIGKAICECLASEGMNISIVDLREDDIRITLEAIKQKDVEATFFNADVSNEQQVIQVVNEVTKRFGSVDVLVNNAGIFESAMIEVMDESFWDKVLSVNLKSVFLFSKAVIPHMKKQKSGRIINAASIVGFIPDISESAYSVSKAAIINFTQSLAAELAPFQITVNAFAPGIVRTPMTEDFIVNYGESELKKMPFERFGKPEEIGYLVAFLSSNLASHITGATIPIAGGNLLALNQWRAYEYYHQ